MTAHIIYNFRYILRLAARTNGIIVTNDNYRDLWQERDEWKEIIANRLVKNSSAQLKNSRYCDNR